MDIISEEKRGIFVDLEGIDGSGTSTQVRELISRLEYFNKYESVLKTHEPWENEKIKIKLETDTDAYSDPQETADLFVGDRTNHTFILIRPNILAGASVFCSRYTLSTLAFQQTQGVSLEKLIRMHENRGILIPDKIYFLDVPREEAARRMKNRAKREKFEGNAEFIDRLIINYHKLVDMSQRDPKLFGEVVRIDGTKSIEGVAEQVWSDFLPFYKEFRGYDFHWRSFSKLQKADTTIDPSYQKSPKDDL